MHRINLMLAVTLLPMLSSTAAIRPGADTTRIMVTHAPTAAVSSPIDKTQVIAGYGKIPLYFEKNAGQTDAKVQYLARGAGYALFLTPDEAVLSLHKSAGKSARKIPVSFGKSVAPQNSASAVVRARLVGATKSAKVRAENPLPGKSNYFIGNDKTKWHTDIAQYAKVRYQGVYPGVDLVYYGNQQQLEYDFVVAPNADPKAIRLSYSGADKLILDPQGNLHIESQGGELIQHKPVVYQMRNGRKEPVEGRFSLVRGDAKNTDVAFVIAGYDRSRELTIDPVLSYSTYFGGNGNDQGYGIAVDGSGSVYVTGITTSTNFPTSGPIIPANAGGIDGFVFKLSPAINFLVYSTYFGGNGTDNANAIAVDSSGNAYVAGDTTSSNFPVVNALQGTLSGPTDAFVIELNSIGSGIIYSTYLGGSGDEKANAIAVDGSGNAYVAGETSSTNFPTQNPLQATNAGSFDAFVTKLKPRGAGLVYSTYLGGSGSVTAFGIAIDSSGNAYVAGSTPSTNFPTQNPLQSANGGGADGFIAKLNAAGSALVYSTFLGGAMDESANAIAVDSSGNAYVTGFTISTNFPTVNPIQAANGGGNADPFVAKLNPAGSALVYSTYLGGNAGDVGFGIGVDGSGNAYVAGGTQSPNFPTQNPLQAANGGLADVFVVRINAAGSARDYSTYLGGSGVDRAFAIAVDPSGNAYVTGRTQSANFPTQAPFQAANAGGSDDAFIAVLAPSAAPPMPTVTITASPTTITLGASSALTWSSTNATNCVPSGAWAGTKAISGTENVTPTATGTPAYTLTCTGTGGSGSATATITVNAVPPPAPTVTIAASPTTLTVGASSMLTWSSTNATACTSSGAWSGTQATSGTASVTPTAAGTPAYTLTCTGTGTGGSGNATAMVTVNAAAPPPPPTSSGKGGGGAFGWLDLLLLLPLAALRRPRRLTAPPRP